MSVIKINWNLTQPIFIADYYRLSVSSIIQKLLSVIGDKKYWTENANLNLNDSK